MTGSDSADDSADNLKLVPSPAFRTASDKSWAWRPGNEASFHPTSPEGFMDECREQPKVLNWACFRTRIAHISFTPL